MIPKDINARNTLHPIRKYVIARSFKNTDSAIIVFNTTIHTCATQIPKIVPFPPNMSIPDNELNRRAISFDISPILNKIIKNSQRKIPAVMIFDHIKKLSVYI
jgi:hypothetical protein